MAGASGNNSEVNYWPGFVDALSNVVLALVFVIVIFTLSLAGISSKIVSHASARQVAKEKYYAEKEKEIADLTTQVQQLQSLLAEKEKLLNLQARSAVRQIQPGAPDFKQLGQSSADITFSYEPGTFDLGPEALEQLGKLMASKGSNPAGKSFNLVAYPASSAFSAEKRSAYFRMVAIRNQLIERGVPPENISTKTDANSVLPGLVGQVRLTIAGRKP